MSAANERSQMWRSPAGFVRVTCILIITVFAGAPILTGCGSEAAGPSDRCVDDPLEPNDSLESATAVSVPGNVAVGVEICGDDVDHYAFEAFSGEVFRFTLSFDGDRAPLINAFSPTGSFRTDDGYRVESGDGVVIATLSIRQPGMQQISVSLPSRVEERVRYSLTAEAVSEDCPNDGLEPNNGFDVATRTRIPGVVARDAIVCGADIDFWAFDADATRYRFEVTYDGAESLDVILFSDADETVGTEFVSVTANEPGLFEFFTVFDAAGEFAISVARSDLERVPATYTIEAEESPQCPDDEFEPNDNPGDAAEAASVPGTLVGGAVVCEDDVDVFSVELEGGTDWELSLEWTGQGEVLTGVQLPNGLSAAEDVFDLVASDVGSKVYRLEAREAGVYFIRFVSGTPESSNPLAYRATLEALR